MYLTLQALCAVYLIFIGACMTASNWLSVLLFKLTPLFLGVVLAFFTLADFMGWPV